MTKSYQDITGDGGSNIVAQINEQVARLRQRMEQVRHKIVILSGKGGVGKSVITANLACFLADRGYRVGALDADFGGPSLAKMLGVHEPHLKLGSSGVLPASGILGLKVMSLDFLLPRDESPVTWDGPVENTPVWQGAMEATVLGELLSDTDWGELDFLLLDLPPGTTKLPTVAQLLPDLSGAIIVTIPSEISYFVVKKSATLAKELGMTILGLVENMAGYLCQNCGTVGELFGTTHRGEETARSLEVPFLGQIPFDSRLAECTDRGKPFILEHPDSPVTTALQGIAEKIETFLGEVTK
jgi:ATP-binding protein involved in chromosome partitioning